MSLKTLALTLASLLAAGCYEHIDALILVKDSGPEGGGDGDGDADGDSDGDSDGDGDCPTYDGTDLEAPPLGDTCYSAIPVNMPYFTMTTTLSDFTDSGEEEGSSCTTSGPDLLFRATVSPGGLFVARENLRLADTFFTGSDGCWPDSSICLAPSTGDDRYFWFFNDETEDYDLVVQLEQPVEEGEEPEVSPVELDLFLVDPARIGSCDEPFEVPDLGTCPFFWAGDAELMQPRFNGDETCLDVNPAFAAATAWFLVSVPAGKTLVVEELPPEHGQSYIHVLDGGCGATSCLLSAQGWVFVTNEGEGTQEYTIVLSTSEAYSDQPVALEFTLQNGEPTG